MLRKMAAAAVLLALSVGLVWAEEFTAVISKVDGDKITAARFKKGKKGDEITLTAVATVKVVKGKRNEEDKKKIEAGDPIEGGLKSEMFTKIGEKGLLARVITNDDGKVTEIRTVPKKE